MSVKVVKFGGSSLADAEHFRQVAAIIKADPERRYVVPSAPGKREKSDTKVTDMLYRCYDLIKSHSSAESIDACYNQIRARYTGIISELGLDFDINGELDYVSISYNQWEDYEDDPRIYEYFNDSLMYFMINHGNPSFGNILGNLNFRKALFHGVDRVAMSEIIGCYPATRLVRRAVMSNPATGVPFYTLPTDYVKTAEEVFDKTLANQLLDKAYEETKQTKVDMRILYSETSTHLRGCAEILQKQYHDHFAGKLNVIMQAMPSAQAQALRKWNPDDPTGFDTALGSFLPTANDPRQTFKFYLSSVVPPRFYWTSDELDKLFAESMELDLESDKIGSAPRSEHKERDNSRSRTEIKTGAFSHSICKIGEQ